MRGGRFTERVGTGHSDLKLARLGQADELQSGRGADLGPRVPSGACTDDLEAKLEPSLEGRNGDDPFAIGDQGDRRVDRLVASDRVDRRVDSAGDEGTDPLDEPVTVDHRFGTELA